MRTRCLAALLILILVGPASVGAQDFSTAASAVASQLTRAGKQRVAVVDFTDLQMNVTELGRYLAEEFQSALVAAPRGFRVVDRTNIKAILQENKLASSGLIDPLTARQLGRIAGVDALVTGSITPFGDTIRLSLKVLESSTADVLATSNIDIPKTAAVAALANQSVGTSSVSISTAPSGFGNEATVNTARQRKTVKDVTIELVGCSINGTSLRCNFSFLNQDRDKGVGIFNGKAFDMRGGEYEATRGQMGNHPAQNFGGNVEARLITGVPTPASVTFEQASPDVRNLSALYLSLFIRDPTTGISVGSEDVDFRNVQVSVRK